MSFTNMRFLAVSAVAAVLVSVSVSASASTIVQMQFSFGLSESPFDTIFIELFDDTPATRDNFLNYVNDGDYNGVVIHRSVPGFVLQGGGFTPNGGSLSPIPTDAPVVNEFGRSNLRGTLAMAKLGGNPDSATSQFFYNLSDNSANLDNQNGGFTVFARVLGNGMDLIDEFATLPTSTVSGLSGVPLRNGNEFLVIDDARVTQLRIGDTDFSGTVDQADADLLGTTLVGGSDQPQFDVDENGTVDQADLDLLNALLLGDIDGDGFVGDADLDMVLANWNQNSFSGTGDADASNDGFIGIDDLNAVLVAWEIGSPPPAAAASVTVPEPASMALLVLGSVFPLLRRR